MNCREFRTFVDAGPLRGRSAQEFQSVRRHADGCPACSEYLDAVVDLERDLAGLPAIAPSEGFSAGVVDRIVHQGETLEHPAADLRSDLLPWAAALIGTAATAVGFVFWIQHEAWTAWLGRMWGDMVAIATAPPSPAPLDAWIEWFGSLPAATVALLSGFWQQIQPDLGLTALASPPTVIQTDVLQQWLTGPAGLSAWLAAGLAILVASLFWLQDEQADAIEHTTSR